MTSKVKTEEQRRFAPPDSRGRLSPHNFCWQLHRSFASLRMTSKVKTEEQRRLAPPDSRGRLFPHVSSVGQSASAVQQVFLRQRVLAALNHLLRDLLPQFDGIERLVL